MALIKLKDLHSRLESVDDFEDPKIDLEQYITTPHIAGKCEVCELCYLLPGVRRNTASDASA